MSDGEIVMSICWSVCTQACCINHNCTSTQPVLNPKQLLSNSCNTQTGIKPVAETGAEQFTSGDSAFSHINLLQPWLNQFRDYQQG